jgi:hypothetical protein
MIRRCRMCNTPRRISLWVWLTEPVIFCPPDEVSACIATLKAELDDTLDEEEPPFPDPQDEEEPEDLWVCSFCEGSGEVFHRRDWETGAYEFVTCSPCEGTGWHDGRVLVGVGLR